MIKTAIGESKTVAEWLGKLSKSEHDAFIYYAKNSTSDVEAFLYARFLNPGFNGSIADLTAWIQERYPKEDLRKVLLFEIDDIRRDIKNVRDMTITGMLDHATAATKIAVLEKELRSHIQAVRSINDGVDRRGLLLAGADRCIREFIQAFEDQPTISDLIRDSSEMVWAAIEREESN
jgi:hypothetical protein